MKYLFILLVLFMSGCPSSNQYAFRDSTTVTKIHLINEVRYGTTYKYAVYLDNTNYFFTNKECTLGMTIWDCK